MVPDNWYHRPEMKSALYYVGRGKACIQYLHLPASRDRYEIPEACFIQTMPAIVALHFYKKH